MNFESDHVVNADHCITEEVIKSVIKCSSNCETLSLKNYTIFYASDKMLGFLADYWKLKIQVLTSANKTKTLYLFIKAISTTNAAKATMVKEMKLFEKEITFYTKIKNKLNTAGVSSWSPKLILSLNEAMIFEDINYLQYKTRNKLEPFDEEHILLALKALARFHASTIIYEEGRSRMLGKCYVINDEHKNDLSKGGYQESDPWFVQCMNGSLETVQKFLKYKDKDIISIKKHWKPIWVKALQLADPSTKYRNVICHRDLWNNNILFRYQKSVPQSIPDDCLLVDFQAVRYQPPAGDVMLLLHCNLELEYRKKYTTKLLDYYYNELRNILKSKGILVENVFSFQDFMKSCDEQNLWGLVVSACLVPQFLIDDDLTVKHFCNTTSFDEILTKNKASFIQNMIENNEHYKHRVLQIFDEIVKDYCLKI